MNAELRKFAGDNVDFYVAFEEYYNCKNDPTRTPSIPLTEMSEKINKGFFAEIERLSGVKKAEAPNAWMANPSVKWAAFALIDQVINSLLPAYITNSLNPFVDMRFVAYGDAVHYKITPRNLFTVSMGAHGERTTFRQKNFKGDLIVAPEERIVTVDSDMYRVLAGKEDIAEFVRLAVLSIERKMTAEAVSALAAGLDASVYPAQFIETGAFKGQTLVELGQRLEAYNFGMRPVIMGTQAALMKVLPDSIAGYRINVAGADGSVGIMAKFYNFDLYELKQIPTGSADFGVELDNNTLYLVSPGADKVIKGAVSNTLTNSNQFYDNADITQNFTLRKDWKFTFASAAYAGKYIINE